MNGYQFVLALIPLIGTFVAQMVALSRQASNHIEAQKAQIQAVEDVKASVNGVQDKLVAAAKEQGHSDEREHPSQGHEEWTR